MKRLSKPLSRRQALVPIAALAIGATPLLSDAIAQPAQPGSTTGYSAAQRASLNAAINSLRRARAQAVGAKLSGGLTDRMTRSIDAAITETRLVLSGRVRG